MTDAASRSAHPAATRGTARCRRFAREHGVGSAASAWRRRSRRGSGENRYQFVHAPDLADACIRALGVAGSHTVNVGSDDVKTMREVYQYVIDHARTKARVASLPKRPTLAAMRAAHVLRVSPLGPYHYKMIAESFVFDTTRAKQLLGWRPGLRNEEMLLEAYRGYVARGTDLEDATEISAHRQPAKMGAIRLLKALS